MKIIVDADACPVKDIIEAVAGEYQIVTILVSNINHHLISQYSQVIVVDGAAQAADIAVSNLSRAGDIVVTQDYGLAAIVLAKGCWALDPNGNQFTSANIDELLMRRFLNQKSRDAGHRTKGPRKRSTPDDRRFELSLRALLDVLAKT